LSSERLENAVVCIGERGVPRPAPPKPGARSISRQVMTTARPAAADAKLN